MIHSRHTESPESVASHYDDLDPFYREIWGNHVHHGFWESGKESVPEATLNLLTRLLADVPLSAGSRVCDIGCGYGETARTLAAQYGAEVLGYTVSGAQYRYAVENSPQPGPRFVLGDWLKNSLEPDTFDLALAIESSEHMPDLEKFFAEAYRVLKPGGRLKICAWLTRERPGRIEKGLLLQPICTEGRLRMGTPSEYLAIMRQAGFRDTHFEDVTTRVKRTWTLCLTRLGKKLATDPKYVRFLLRNPSSNKSFLASLLRIRIAYESGAMVYGFLGGRK
jgi:tocopherol O-methyltransferase